MTNTITVQDLINEVSATRGATVSIFGHHEEIPKDIPAGTIDILDILEAFKGYEKEMYIPGTFTVEETEDGYFNVLDASGDVIETEETEEEAEEACYDLSAQYMERTGDIDAYLDQLSEYEIIKEVNSNNSYNWLGNVSNHFNYTTYEHEDGTYLIEFKAHLYGDVRGNYTDTVLLAFDDEYTFSELIGEQDASIDINGYEIRFGALSDAYEISKDYDYICNKYSYEDVLDYIEELKETEV